MKYRPKIMFFELCIQSMRETPWFSSPVFGMDRVSFPHGSVETGTSFSIFNACWLKRIDGHLRVDEGRPAYRILDGLNFAVGLAGRGEHGAEVSIQSRCRRHNHLGGRRHLEIACRLVARQRTAACRARLVHPMSRQTDCDAARCRSDLTLPECWPGLARASDAHSPRHCG